MVKPRLYRRTEEANVSRPEGPGRPEKITFGRSGRAPRHVRTRDGGDEYRYAPHDLDPGNRANSTELIRQLQGSRATTIQIGIVGQLSEPYLDYEEADVTLFHPANVRRTQLIRLLGSGVTLEEALSQATAHEWSEVYTVYLAEWVRPT